MKNLIPLLFVMISSIGLMGRELDPSAANHSGPLTAKDVFTVNTLQVEASATCSDQSGTQAAENTYYILIQNVSGGSGTSYTLDLGGNVQTFNGTPVYFGPFNHSGLGGAVQSITATEPISGESCVVEIPEVLCGVNQGGQASGIFCDIDNPQNGYLGAILAQSQPGTFTAGGNSGSIQAYVLVDANNNIVEVNTSGLFSGIAPGTYTPYALNYASADNGSFTPFLGHGTSFQTILDGFNNTGSLASLCFDLCNADGLVTYTLGFCGDYGDLPDFEMTTAYPTNNTDGGEGLGAAHTIISNFSIGQNIDLDADGLASNLALGDDQDNLDDEDGISLPNMLFAGGEVNFSAEVLVPSGTSARLLVWIDWNADRQFDSTESFSSELIIGSDGNLQNVALSTIVPIDANTNQLLGARFRLFDVNDANQNPTGFATLGGEVEDYLIGVKPCPTGNCR